MVRTQQLLSQMLRRGDDAERNNVLFYDLFCGIGGASLGAEMAGIDGVAFGRLLHARTEGARTTTRSAAPQMIPCADDAIPWPENGAPFHLQARRLHRDHQDEDDHRSRAQGCRL